MSKSAEFAMHTRMFCENLQMFVGQCAIEVENGQTLGSGLLNPRIQGYSFFRPRLIVVSGLASVVSRIFDRVFMDDLFVIGAARDDDPAVRIDRLYAACAGVALDLLKNTNLDDGQIVRFSHSVRIAESEELNMRQAKHFHGNVCDRLEQIEPK